jgi:hypothetical protein
MVLFSIKLTPIGCDAETADNTAKRLATEGFLVPLKVQIKTSIPKRKSWQITKNQDTILQTIHKYFVPTLDLDFLVRVQDK